MYQLLMTPLMSNVLTKALAVHSVFKFSYSQLNDNFHQATNRCVRGSRTKWRSGAGMEDGAALAMMMR